VTAEDQKRGIYRKYTVTRTDGSSESGGKHEHCSYFVLDLEHDQFAISALKAYAKACRRQYPELAAHIDSIVSTRPCGCRSIGECVHFLSPQTPSEQLTSLMANAKYEGSE
jgi:hypothetical protein